MAAQKRENQTTSQQSQRRFKKQRRLLNHLHHGLPDDVLENVFSFLPIKKAVQIGVLSTRFKDSWLFSRNLIFDRDFSRGLSQAEFSAIVNRVLNSHSGVSIKSFRLYFDSSGFENLFENWIKKASEKGVEEIDLDFCQAIDLFRLSSEFLDIKTLRILKLSHCELSLPPKLKILGSLNTLVLRKVDVSANSIESIFLNCMALQTFDMARCRRIWHLKILARGLKKFRVLKVGDCLDISRIHIDAPTLSTIYYSGIFCVFDFSDGMHQLKDVMLNFTAIRSFTLPAKVRNLVLEISRIHVLTISSTFLEGLSAKFEDGVMREPNFCMHNLKELQLFMEPTSFANIYDIALFLKNCLSLENIFIDLPREFNFENGLYCEMHQKHKVEEYYYPLRHLKLIRLTGFKYQKLEVDLVKFLMQKARFLETVVLVPADKSYVKFCSSSAYNYYDQFLSSNYKATPSVRIINTDSAGDRRSFIYPKPKHSKIWY